MKVIDSIGVNKSDIVWVFSKKFAPTHVEI